MTHSEAQSYLNQMVSRRGYALPYHKIMAQHDFDVLKSVDALVAAVYTDSRRLSGRDKELVFVATLVAQNASTGQIASHIRLALDYGVSSAELRGMLMLLEPTCGADVVYYGIDILDSDFTVDESPSSVGSISEREADLVMIATQAQRRNGADLDRRIRNAVASGTDAYDLLEALEILIPECGVVTFQFGLAIWAKATNASMLEPSSSFQ